MERIIKMILIIAVVSLLVTAWCASQVIRPNHRLEALAKAPSPAESVEERLKKLEASAPGMGEVMSGVQVHFAKLWFAGEARNWKLAEFEMDEIKENLDSAVAIRREENGVNMVGVADAFKQTQLAALEEAIGQQNADLFRKSYEESITTCNGCHQATGRPFITIITPAAPPVPNQQWEPPSE